MNRDGHIGELDLRRRRAGEALGEQGPAIEAHAAVCAECKARLRALDDEQRRFEAAISFDRFSAGVERAARGGGAAPRRRAPVRAWMVVPTLAMAAAVAVVVTFHSPSARVHPPGYDGIKGGAGMIVRVAGATGQRTARVDAAEALAPGAIGQLVMTWCALASITATSLLSSRLSKTRSATGSAVANSGRPASGIVTTALAPCTSTTVTACARPQKR